MARPRVMFGSEVIVELLPATSLLAVISMSKDNVVNVTEVQGSTYFE